MIFPITIPASKIRKLEMVVGAIRKTKATNAIIIGIIRPQVRNVASTRCVFEWRYVSFQASRDFHLFSIFPVIPTESTKSSNAPRHMNKKDRSMCWEIWVTVITYLIPENASISSIWKRVMLNAARRNLFIQ